MNDKELNYRVSTAMYAPQIKPVDQRDEATINSLLAIWESSVMNTHTFLSETDIIAIKPDAKKGLESVEKLYSYSDENGKMHGFIGIQEDKIEMLFIGATARGQGIGRQLLSFAVADLGARFVDVNEQNEQGVGFYMHMGFIVTGRSELDEQGRPFPILHLKAQGDTL